MLNTILIERPEIKTALPGPKAKQIINTDAEYVTQSYPRTFPLVAESAQGVWIRDVDGNIFLDCNAGVAVCSTGHCHPEIVEVIKEQTERLIHIGGNNYYYSHLSELARKLDEITPVPSPTRTHFTTSGTEAIETALKLAIHATKREKFIAFLNSFHGRTLGALSLTASKAVQRKGFGRQLLDVTHVSYPYCLRCPFNKCKQEEAGCCLGQIDWIEDRLFNTIIPPEECAAIIVECVQSEGGYIPAPAGFLHGLRSLCEKYQILLIVDEVQSGMGRTGKMFACDHYNLKPDILCVAKGIASGMPLGACIARADIMNWQPGSHASTFGGNPVAIAAAMKTIKLLERELIENSALVGAYIQNNLVSMMKKYDCIGDVRGLGMMIGVEIVESRSSMKADLKRKEHIERSAFEQGLLICGAGGYNTVRWSPPLIFTQENADVALEIFESAIEYTQ